LLKTSICLLLIPFLGLTLMLLWCAAIAAIFT
jgi:hypothetical protein